ncbi:unnamed protein product [Dicrocoelium dendriticum]|nr:unnamed protein product [Dicrocoelium dendriticum]
MRMCSDLAFCLIFFSALLMLIITAFFTSMHGKLTILSENYDCFGNICGQQRNIDNQLPRSNMSHKKFLVHTNFVDLHHSIPICVDECINYTILHQNALKKYLLDKNTSLCDCRVPVNLKLSYPRLGNTPLCMELPIEASEPILGVCIPKIFKIFPTYFTNDRPSRVGPLIVKLHEDLDFNLPWVQVLICPLVTLGLALIFTLFVRCIPSRVIPLAFVCLHVGLCATIILLSLITAASSRVLARLGWWPGNLIRSLEQSGQGFSVLLLCINVLAIVMATVLTIKYWNPVSRRHQAHRTQTEQLLRIIATVLREAPGAVYVAHITGLLMLTALLLLFTLVFLLLLTTVETVRMNTTGCVTVRPYPWISYGVIPVYVFYTLWMIRFCLSLSQTVTVVFVSSWYQAAAPKTRSPIFWNLSLVCEHICFQGFGSLSLASLLSLFSWLPLQILSLARIGIAGWSADDEAGADSVQKGSRATWTLERHLRQMDCTIFTLIVTKRQSFAKCWSSLHNGLCDRVFSHSMVELMRGPETLITMAKIGCALIASGIGLARFPTKPPAVYAFPAALVASIFLSFLVATATLSTLQHILSTVLVSFCLQEEDLFTISMVSEDVMVGFQHENVKEILLSKVSPAHQEPIRRSNGNDEIIQQSSAVPVSNPARKP